MSARGDARGSDGSPIHYFFSTEENFNKRPIEITGKTAFESLTWLPTSQQTEPCVIEIAKVVDTAIKKSNASLLAKWTNQKTLNKREPLIFTFNVSIWGNKGYQSGHPHPDSFRCHLTMDAREGVSENSSGPILSYDRNLHQFLPYDKSVFDDLGVSTSYGDHVSKAILNKGFPELLEVMNSKSEEDYANIVKARLKAQELKRQLAAQKAAAPKVDESSEGPSRASRLQ